MAREPLWSVDDVKEDINEDPPRPSYEELIRWCGRYPQYSEELADLFLDLAIQNIDDGAPQDLIIFDEDEQIAAQGMDAIDFLHYAGEILRRQGKAMPPRPVTRLEPFDREVLAAVYELRGDGFSKNIARKISPSAGAPVLPSSVTASLTRMEGLGLIFINPRAPSFCRISIGGKRALAKMRKRK